MQVIVLFLLLVSNYIVANSTTDGLFATALFSHDMPLAYPLFLAKQAVTAHKDLTPLLLLSIQAARVDLVKYFIKAGVVLNPDEHSPYYVLNPLELAQSYARKSSQSKELLQKRRTVVHMLEDAGAQDRQGNKALFY